MKLFSCSLGSCWTFNCCNRRFIRTLWRGFCGFWWSSLKGLLWLLMEFLKGLLMEFLKGIVWSLRSVCFDWLRVGEYQQAGNVALLSGNLLVTSLGDTFDSYVLYHCIWNMWHNILTPSPTRRIFLAWVERRRRPSYRPSILSPVSWNELVI